MDENNLSEQAISDRNVDEKAKPHIVGVNHIALEVGNIDEALAFYGQIFSFELRGRGRSVA